MKLKDLKGIICDYVELSWKEDGGFITHYFDDMNPNGIDEMYSTIWIVKRNHSLKLKVALK